MPLKKDTINLIAELLQTIDLRSLREIFPYIKNKDIAFMRNITLRASSKYKCMPKELRARYRGQAEELLRLLKDLGYEI